MAALAHAQRIHEFASATADLVFVTPRADEDLLGIIAEIGDGSPERVAELILRWHDLGPAGVRLRPAVHATGLRLIVDEVVPLLQRSGRFRTSCRDGETLRGRLGLSVAQNRYTEVSL